MAFEKVKAVWRKFRKFWVSGNNRSLGDYHRLEFRNEYHYSQRDREIEKLRDEALMRMKTHY